MSNRDKIIKALELCSNREWVECTKCPYTGNAFCVEDLMGDALKLLKPRVLTLEEAKNAYVIEYKSGKMREVGSALLNINVDPLNAKYGEIYRVWTSRPSDEQRRTVPWKEPS